MRRSLTHFRLSLQRDSRGNSITLASRNVRFTLVSADSADAGGGDEPLTFEAKIGFVSPEVDPVSHQVRVWAEIDNADGLLRPGQQGRLEILP